MGMPFPGMIRNPGRHLIKLSIILPVADVVLTALTRNLSLSQNPSITRAYPAFFARKIPAISAGHAPS